VELYLDPEIASPRKVSVWYSFWGEASSRQEYYDICGRKDEDFAALVRDLVARVIALTGEDHLDTEGIALGLMGALEVLWQGIAFQSEADIDRGAARAQCMAFLRSVFPRQFGGVGAAAGASAAASGGGAAAGDGAGAGAGAHGGGASPTAAGAGGRAGTVDSIRRGPSGLPRYLPSWAYVDATLLTAERERLFRPAWQVIGHEAEVPAAGDFLTGDLGSERALVVRDAKGNLRAFRNACRRRPHALVSVRTGHFTDAIPCVPHGLEYGFDGKLLDGGTDGDLTPLEIKQKGGLILVRAAGVARESGGPALTGWDEFAALAPTGVQELDVAADWKVLVEQWLERSPSRWRFLAPNQLVAAWQGNAVVLRVVPLAPGRSRLQRLNYRQATKRGGKRSAGAAPRSGADAASELLDKWLAQQVELAESTQTGLASAGNDSAENGPVSAALAEFRGSIAVLLPHLAADSPATRPAT
jgi:nitrite reductase/ring-hydroxylating ferredoxin subunit